MLLRLVYNNVGSILTLLTEIHNIPEIGYSIIYVTISQLRGTLPFSMFSYYIYSTMNTIEFISFYTYVSIFRSAIANLFLEWVVDHIFTHFQKLFIYEKNTHSLSLSMISKYFKALYVFWLCLKSFSSCVKVIF